jgi:hypothetical protein
MIPLTQGHYTYPNYLRNGGFSVKTLSYVVILLLSLVVPVRATMVYSGCAAPPSSFRQVWYVDPVNGKTPAAGGKGSQAAPWNSLNGVLSGYWATAGWDIPRLHPPAAVDRSLLAHRQRRARGRCR